MDEQIQAFADAKGSNILRHREENGQIVVLLEDGRKFKMTPMELTDFLNELDQDSDPEPQPAPTKAAPRKSSKKGT